MRIRIIMANLHLVLMDVMDGIIILFIIVVMDIIHQWEIEMLVNMRLTMDLLLMKMI